MQGYCQRKFFAGLCLLLCWQSGCAAFRPMSGVPARYLPAEMKVGERSGRRTINLDLLTQPKPVAHLIDTGDVMGVYIEGIVGREKDPPPVHFPQNNDSPPSFGLPFPVRADGTISLPQVGSVYLRGLTEMQAEEKVKLAYLKPKEILNQETMRVQVNLQRPRQYRVLVVRQDSKAEPASNAFVGQMNVGTVKRGTGKIVNLPAYSNDVLNALTAAEGLPGLDAENAVYVIRRRTYQPPGAPGTNIPLDFDPSTLIKQNFAPKEPVIRGQSPDNADQTYLHAPASNPPPPNGQQSGSLRYAARNALQAGSLSSNQGASLNGSIRPNEPIQPPRIWADRTLGSDGQLTDSPDGNGITGESFRTPPRSNGVSQASNFDSTPRTNNRSMSVTPYSTPNTTAPFNGSPYTSNLNGSNQGNQNYENLAQAPSAQGLPSPGHSTQGSPSRRFPIQGYATQAYPTQGYATQASATQAYPIQAYPIQGSPTQGYPTQGYPTQGYPTQGYPTQAYPTQGYSGQSNTSPNDMGLYDNSQFNSQSRSPMPNNPSFAPAYSNGQPSYTNGLNGQPGNSSPYTAPPIGSPMMNPSPDGSPYQPVPYGRGPIVPQSDHPAGHTLNGNDPYVDAGIADGNAPSQGRHVIRIPIRLGPGETADIRPEDVVLDDGDILFIESRDTEVYYTGGLLGGGQYLLPRDYDLDIMQAISVATNRNNTVNNAVGGVSALNSDVAISPSNAIVIRRLPDGGEIAIKVDLYRARVDRSERLIIKPGDFILLQYTPLEAIGAFLERHLLESALFSLAAQQTTKTGG